MLLDIVLRSLSTKSLTAFFDVLPVSNETIDSNGLTVRPASVANSLLVGVWPEIQRASITFPGLDVPAAMEHLTRRLGVLRLRGLLIAPTTGVLAFVLIPDMLAKYGLPIRPLTFDPVNIVVSLIFFVTIDYSLSLVSGYCVRKRATRLFRDYLRRQGFSVCARCGYALDVTLGTRCPECGTHSSQ